MSIRRKWKTGGIDIKSMTVWALFDSGNGSYTKGAKELNCSGGANIDIYPIGIDIEKWTNFSRSYNEKSNIPQKLVTEIFEKVYKIFVERFINE